MPEIGQTISHYRIVEKIGKGGMGEVYLADDTTLDRKVTIKVLSEEFAKDHDRVARFQREAKLIVSLNHPNIAAIYGLEESDDTHITKKKFLSTCNLRKHHLSNFGSLPGEDRISHKYR